MGERTATAGCGRAAAPGQVTITEAIAGRQRTVRVRIPPGYTGKRPLPLLLNLHGTGSTAAKQERASGLDATADEHGFVVAYPQAARHSGGGFAWNIPGTPSFASRGPNDVAYLGDVVRLLGERYCVDTGRVYASGFSGGARMASQLACTPPVRLAGLVAVSGIRAPSGCHPSGGAVPVLAFHGTADRTNPYHGHGQPYWTYSVPVAAARWARYDGCPAGAATGRPFPGVTVTSYRGCRDGGTVELYTLAGKGHRWPPASGAFRPNEILWQFLSGQGRPAPSIPPDPSALSALPRPPASRSGAIRSCAGSGC
ncbi:CE1 family esterase [Rugosimonospora acidiphila]|uniref:alpha/beta hydrolase family esterase n=1 Tax=Rugosimonospora acidiphila TaxID=556531 RepID=UPI0031EA16FD